MAIPDYNNIIKKPMDFGTIKKKLQFNLYSSPYEFKEDVDLVFNNCLLYNGVNSYIY